MYHPEITSKSNPKIKAAIKIRDSASARRESGLFFAEGARLCADAAGSTGLTTCFFTAEAAEKFPSAVEMLTGAAEESYLINRECAQRLGDTQNPQGIFCLCAVLDKNRSLDTIYNSRRLVILENLQDPANLGATARTAEALGIDGAVLGGCCDIYNPKAQRASMGSLLRLPVYISDDLTRTAAELKANGFELLATTPDSSACSLTEIRLGEKVACVIGNEGNGLTQRMLALCDRAVTIPMKGRAESLNASAAAAIVMWELMR